MSRTKNQMANCYAGTGHVPKDTLLAEVSAAVSMISAAAMSNIGITASSVTIKKQTFVIDGAEYEFVMDIGLV